jgi:hypothetical protein
MTSIRHRRMREKCSTGARFLRKCAKVPKNIYPSLMSHNKPVVIGRKGETQGDASNESGSLPPVNPDNDYSYCWRNDMREARDSPSYSAFSDGLAKVHRSKY